MAFALPAASEPPMSVQTTSQDHSPMPIPGTSRAARTMAGTVVTSRSSMIRGLVRAM